MGDTLDKVGCAVQGVDNPDRISVGVVPAAFLCQNLMVRKMAVDDRGDGAFCFLIHAGNKIVFSFWLDVLVCQTVLIMEALGDDFARRIGRLSGGVKNIHAPPSLTDCPELFKFIANLDAI